MSRSTFDGLYLQVQRIDRVATDRIVRTSVREQLAQRIFQGQLLALGGHRILDRHLHGNHRSFALVSACVVRQHVQRVDLPARSPVLLHAQGRTRLVEVGYRRRIEAISRIARGIVHRRCTVGHVLDLHADALGVDGKSRGHGIGVDTGLDAQLGDLPRPG